MAGAFVTLLYTKKSMFSIARNLLLNYNLPKAHELTEDIPRENTWKEKLRNALSIGVKVK